VDQLMKLTTKKRLDAALPASRLTDREREVLRMYAIGSRPRTIAYALKISEDTVREHLRHAMIKLDARHLGHAVNLAYHGGLLD
jgi:DNA-binding CsgD family transcriptional regulator